MTAYSVAAKAIWGAACLFFGWSGSCTKFFQAMPVGMGGYLRNSYQNTTNCVEGSNYPTSVAFECMPIGDDVECNKTLTSVGLPCKWCNHPAKHVEQFGQGSCMMAIMHSLGCVSIGPNMFDPMNATGVENIPNAAEQAACLFNNKDRETCEGELHQGQNCSYCDMPDVYGWRPYTGMCMQRNIMVDEGWCEMLTDVPDSAQDILQTRKCQTTTIKPTSQPTTTSQTETTASPTGTTSSTSNGHHHHHLVIPTLLMGVAASITTIVLS